jgi:DNA-binding transcriptional MerR regulator
MPDTDELLTPEEVAKRLSVSIRSVRRFADTGQLVPIRLGRYVRYRAVDVALLLARRRLEDGHHTGQDGHRTAPIADMTGVADSALATLRQELGALRQENSLLRAELTTKAEAAGMWQGRARTLEEQVRQLAATSSTPAVPTAPGDTETPNTPDNALTTPKPVQSLWTRIGRLFSWEK